MSLDIAGNNLKPPAPVAAPAVHRMKVLTVNTH